MVRITKNYCHLLFWPLLFSQFRPHFCQPNIRWQNKISVVKHVKNSTYLHTIYRRGKLTQNVPYFWYYSLAPAVLIHVNLVMPVSIDFMQKFRGLEGGSCWVVEDSQRGREEKMAWDPSCDEYRAAAAYWYQDINQHKLLSLIQKVSAVFWSSSPLQYCPSSNFFCPCIWYLCYPTCMYECISY